METTVSFSLLSYFDDTSQLINESRSSSAKFVPLRISPLWTNFQIWAGKREITRYFSVSTLKEIISQND